MARPYKPTSESVEIRRRYFEAVELLKKERRIKSYSDYCRAYEIDISSFFALRKHEERGTIAITWMAGLVRDFGISGTWLLAGRGAMIEMLY